MFQLHEINSLDAPAHIFLGRNLYANAGMINNFLASGGQKLSIFRHEIMQFQAKKGPFMSDFSGFRGNYRSEGSPTPSSSLLVTDINFQSEGFQPSFFQVKTQGSWIWLTFVMTIWLAPMPFPSIRA